MRLAWLNFLVRYDCQNWLILRLLRVVHVPLSGDQSVFGEDIKQAAELAVQQLSAPLNELGYKIGRPARERLFIDDSKANIEQAEKMGFVSVHFTSPEQLKTELKRQKLIPTGGIA